MKKIVIPVLLCLAAALQASAQEADLRFGFQLSPSFNWMQSNANANAVESKGTQLGFTIGMVGENYFRENYAFKGGVNMTFAQGGKLAFAAGGNIFDESADVPDVAAGGEVQYRLQYLEIPLGMKFRTNEIGYIRYYAEIPTFNIGFNVAARGEINNEDYDIASDIALMNLMWGFGGGLEYSLSASTSVVGGIHYESGFSDITGDTDADGSKATLQRITLRLGVMF